MKSTRTYTMSSRAEAVTDTRERIVRSAIGLLLENWYEDVTLAAIAAAAGVSHQTVLNHFESKEGVALGRGRDLRRETSARRGRAPPSDVAGAVHALVATTSGSATRMSAGRRPPSGSDVLRALLDEARASHQQWLGQCSPSVSRDTASERRRAINALHAATDVYTWKLLRRDLGLSRTETERTMVDLVTGVLSEQRPRKNR